MTPRPPDPRPARSRGRRPQRVRLDLDSLPADVAALLEAASDPDGPGLEIELRRSGESRGAVSLHSATLVGDILSEPRPAGDRAASAGDEGRDAPEDLPEDAGGNAGGDVTVVATAMELSASARSRLAEQFGEGFLVLDLHEAPPSAEVLLVPPVSPQLIGALKAQFPQATLLITEIEDEELGVHCAGPVSRMLDAGATAYLPPRALDEVAPTVAAHLERSARRQLDGPSTTGRRAADGTQGPREISR